MPRRGENRDIIIVATVTFFPLLTLKQKKEETFLLAIFFLSKAMGKENPSFLRTHNIKGRGDTANGSGERRRRRRIFPFPMIPAEAEEENPCLPMPPRRKNPLNPYLNQSVGGHFSSFFPYF